MNTIFDGINAGVKRKVLHLSAKNTGVMDGRTVNISNKDLVNFSSYSYLGLEVDDRIKKGGIDAILKYGSQFGSSRAFVAIDLLEEMEYLLAQLFQAHVVVAPSTTLAHQACLPVVIGDNDFVLLDQHVHASVKTTADMLKARKIPVEIIRHNRMDLLEERIIELSRKYDQVWYMADGVYSMYGDFAPLEQLNELMDRYPKFHLYIDDAHGMSWTGSNGAGYVLSQIGLHEQMILVTSLNKSFSGAGGVIATLNHELHKRIKTCGGTLIFSTPIQPPMIGVNVASAKIHLSDDIYVLQSEFRKRVEYCHYRLKQLGLPDVSEKESPIFYIATGTPKVSFNLIEKIISDGFYASPAIFPAVGLRQSGVRFCINVNHSFEDIDGITESLQRNFQSAFYEEGSGTNVLPRYFGRLANWKPNELRSKTNVLQLDLSRTIESVHKREWDRMFGSAGSFDWDGLQFLEQVYSVNHREEDNWEFFYVVVRDENKKPILATFFTLALSKEDMFAKSKISEILQEQRIAAPYHLCSKVLMMGSLMTEGNHLFVDYTSTDWNQALSLLLDQVNELQDQTQVNQVVFRDFDENDRIKERLIEEGFARVDLPKTSIIDQTHLRWGTTEEYLKLISSNDRGKLRRSVLRNEKYYNVRIVEQANEEQINHWYELYKNIHGKAFEINTFAVPKKFFFEALRHPKWEVLELSIKREYTESDQDVVVAIGLIYNTGTTYSPMVLGIDYDYVQSHGNYRQAIFQLVKRAKNLELNNIYMGFTADIEKKRFGAKSYPRVAFSTMNDSFNAQLISSMDG